MTTATATYTNITATVRGDALREGLAAALLFADVSTLATAGVMIQIKGPSVILAATDRYRLVEITIPIIAAYGDGMEEMARVSFDDAKALLATLKAAKMRGYSVDLNVSAAVLTARVLGASQIIGIDPATAGRPVPYVHLFPLFLGETEKGIATPYVSLNPAYLADFAKVAGKGNPITMRFSGDGKIISVESVASKGNDLFAWRGLLMPVRVSS
jgi:DNA polymerase III sliding clamp (beta) subunit (PCNA family)